MDIEGWIWTIALGLITALLAVELLRASVLYFEHIDKTQIIEKQLKVPGNGVELNAKVVFPRFALNAQGRTREKLPIIIFNHGWGAPIDHPATMQYAVALAVGGPYAVLLHDCRGFGKSPGKRKLDEAMFDDIPRVIDFAMTLDDVDPLRIGFAGVSMGGNIALARAYPDTRVKAIVAMCAPHNARNVFARKRKNFLENLQVAMLNVNGVHGKQITSETNMQISPEHVLDKNATKLNERVMLVHAKDDSLIQASEFEANRAVLGLQPDRVLFLEHGGHALLRQELLVLGSMLRFFKAKL
jgi:pimeloyl-ACP methyl ester carboxylesterase